MLEKRLILHTYIYSMKVRLQTSGGNGGMVQLFREFGGVSSLFRGMGPPLGAAAAVNAIVFGSYGFSSRLYDTYITAKNVGNYEQSTPPISRSPVS